VCNYVKKHNINGMFHNDNSTKRFIDGYLKFVADENEIKELTLDKLSRLVQLHLNTVDYTKPEGDKNFNTTQDNKFNDYGIVKTGDKFINKLFMFEKYNHNTTNNNDFNIKLFKITPNGLEEENKIHITDIIPNTNNTTNEFVFDLLNLLQTLYMQGVYNVTIIDYTCSNFEYPGTYDNTSNYLIGKQFNQFYNSQTKNKRKNITQEEENIFKNMLKNISNKTNKTKRGGRTGFKKTRRKNKK
jgi:hypothetical protein